MVQPDSGSSYSSSKENVPPEGSGADDFEFGEKPKVIQPPGAGEDLYELAPVGKVIPVEDQFSNGHVPADEAQHTVPEDEDGLEEYLVREELVDASVETSQSLPLLPKREEISSALRAAQSALKDSATNKEVLNAFSHIASLYSRVDQRFFEVPFFGNTPYQKLVVKADIVRKIEEQLSLATKKLTLLFTKSPELILHSFYNVVNHYVATDGELNPSSSSVAGENAKFVVVKRPDPSIHKTLKSSAQLSEDCSLAGDRFITQAGFRPRLPELEAPTVPKGEDGKPVGMENFSEGDAYLKASAERNRYRIRRDSDDVPTIQIGQVREGVEVSEEGIQSMAGILRDLAVQELSFVRKFSGELCPTLTLAKERARSCNEELVPYEKLKKALELLADRVIRKDIWRELEGHPRSVFKQLRNQKKNTSEQAIDAAAYAEAKALEAKQLRIRFLAAYLLSKNTHPEVRYVYDPMKREQAALQVARELVETGKDQARLRDSTLETSPFKYNPDLLLETDDGEEYKLAEE